MTRPENNQIRSIYYFFIVLQVFNTMKISLFWNINGLIFSYLAFFVTIIIAFPANLFVIKSDKIQLLTLLTYLGVVLLEAVFHPHLNIFSFISFFFIKAVVIIGVILLKDTYKKELLQWINKALIIILIISITAWLLYLAGFPLSHGPEVDIGDGFHYLYNYKFFVTSYATEMASFPRFSSMFLEPGWIGTMCIFALITNSFDLKKLSSWIYGAGIILSMSLSAIVNLLICVLFWIVGNNKHRFLALSSIIIFLGIIVTVGLTYNNGNNPLNELIIERLMFDEDLGIVGNNRTNDDFDYQFEAWAMSSDKWFGIRSEVDKDFIEMNSWYSHSSGFKKELLLNGYIGNGLFISFLLMFFYKYRSYNGFIFLLCFLLASFIRNLWRSDYYIVYYILSLAYLYTNPNINSLPRLCQNH